MYTKSVMHMQSCCFAHYANCFFDVPVAVACVQTSPLPQKKIERREFYILSGSK